MAKDTVLNALMLLKAIHDREIVLLAPKTLEQLEAAIAAERSRIDVRHVTVVAIKDGVVHESFMFSGLHHEIGKLSEAKFLNLCRNQVPTWDEYNEDDVASFLEDGYCEYGVNSSICITWPWTEDETASQALRR